MFSKSIQRQPMMIPDRGQALLVNRTAVKAIFLSDIPFVLHQAIATGIDDHFLVKIIPTIPAARAALIPADILNPLHQIHCFTFLAIGAPNPGIVPVETAIENPIEIALESL